MMDLLGWENWRNWPDQFEKKHAASWNQAEILERVRRLEALHWKVCATGIAICSLGVWILLLGIAFGIVSTSVAGCTSLIVGFLVILQAKFASTASLCAYHILWDIRKSEEEAVRKSEIEDL